MQRCTWCRAPNVQAYLPYALVHKVRRLHKQHQIELAEPISVPSGDVPVCAGCSEAVQAAIVEVYLERRKDMPANIEQLEDAEAEARRLEKVAQDANTARENAEAENFRLKRQLTQQQERIAETAKFFASGATRLLEEDTPECEAEIED